MTQTDHRPLSILVVDDDVLVREVTAMMLADEGHSVSEAADGVDALEQLVEKPSVDLVITDINMPRMDGLALAREVEHRWPTVPVLLISGRPQPSSRHVMTKPFGWNTLVNTVRQVVGAGQPWATAGV